MIGEGELFTQDRGYIAINYPTGIHFLKTHVLVEIKYFWGLLQH